MNKIVEIDMVCEEIWQEVKNELSKYLRTSERVSRAILWILLGWADSIIKPQDITLNIFFFFIIFIVADFFLKIQDKTHDGTVTLDTDKILVVMIRTIALLWTLISVSSWELGPAFYWAYWYTAVNIHNSGGKSIWDMVKNAVGKMKKQLWKV